jgi:eukaryotic-like serine/threonine-protein kinase
MRYIFESRKDRIKLVNAWFYVQQDGNIMTAEISSSAITKIGRYRITGELGRGGMGIVYQGEDRLIGRRVAIKTLTEVTPELRERFYLEARSGILSHPNIVTVYELGEHEGSPFIAMEFIEGDSLEKILRTQKRLSLLEALSIVEQICAGLGYAHGHGVVHRDVKPANILVRPDGRITIVDFGIARLADQTKQLTKTDTLLGTFHYIAPERLKGEVSDGKADIWSVGVMLYEMLTGELPFKGRDVSALYRVIHEPYVPLGEHIQDMPDDLSRVFDKALAKQLDARYATAEEMAFDLHVLAQGLKHDRVGSLLETARRLTDQNQFASARTVLLQAQRVDPANSEARILLVDVQDRLSHLHREEQLRQLIDEVRDAETGRRWSDVVELLKQAQRLDTGNAFNLAERLQTAQDEKSKQQKVLELWKQANDARDLGDLAGAQDYLGQALKIDSRNTELRDAYSDLSRELKGYRQQRRLDELLQSARDKDEKKRYTEAISLLREAIEIDPVHPEARSLLLSVTDKQKGEQREKGPDSVNLDVQKPADQEKSGSGEDHATRILEMLPADGLQQQNKSEVKDEKRSVDLEQGVTALAIPIEQAKSTGDGVEATKLLQMQQQSREGTKEEGDLTVQFSEALLKAQFGAAPGAAPGSSQELRAPQYELTADAKNKEIRASVDAAIAACEKAIGAKDFDNCLRSLDSLEKLHPGDALVIDARVICKSKREQRATGILKEAVRSAQQHLEKHSAQKAQAVLREIKYAAPYATPDARNDWERLERECETSLRTKPSASKSGVPIKLGKTRLYVMVFTAASALLAVAVVSYRRHEPPIQPSTAAVNVPASVPVAPSVISTEMEINASPWAKVVSVQERSGKNVTLPDGDTTTPLRLEAVDSGVYEVTVAGPNNEQKTVECNVSPGEHLCSIDIGSITVEKALTGER